jgi:ribosomal protein S18 acetylase RimI-like enzyme
MGAISIRPARLQDLPGLLALHRRLDELQRPWRLFPLRGDFHARIEARFRADVEREDVAFVVADEGADVVGMAVGEVGRPSSFSDEVAVEVSSVVVDPTHRNRGVAGALVMEILAFARARGVSRMTVRVFAQNEEALTFWSGIGFTTRILQMTGTLDDIERKLGRRGMPG